MNAVEAHELYRFFHTEDEETLALRGVSLSVGQAEIVAVIGPSGSGKSTLLSCICGIDEPDGGYVLINGSRITRKSEPQRAAIRAKSVGIVMQAKNLLNHLSVRDNIALKMWLGRQNGKKSNVNIKSLLEWVDLTERGSFYPLQLSGGEAARAALAVALAARPAILIADEPTGEVDRDTEMKIIQLFQKYKADGGSAIIATHSEALAGFADKVIKLRDGRIPADG